MRDCEPVAMNLKVCGFAICLLQVSQSSVSLSLCVCHSGGGGEIMEGESRATHYAGKRRTLKAVASTAHCAIEGYISDMDAYPERRRGVQWLRVNNNVQYSTILEYSENGIKSGSGVGITGIKLIAAADMPHQPETLCHSVPYSVQYVPYYCPTTAVPSVLYVESTHKTMK